MLMRTGSAAELVLDSWEKENNARWRQVEQAALAKSVHSTQA